MNSYSGQNVPVAAPTKKPASYSLQPVASTMSTTSSANSAPFDQSAHRVEGQATLTSTS
jgi:hypothetical protein